MPYGITGIGTYVPRLRIERKAIAAAHRWMAPSLAGQAKGRRAFCSWDEDAITMAVEAGRNALGDRDAEAIGAVYLASTTLPYADLQNASIAAAAIGVGHETRTIDLGHSQRAAMEKPGVHSQARTVCMPAGRPLFFRATRMCSVSWQYIGSRPTLPPPQKSSLSRVMRRFLGWP